MLRVWFFKSLRKIEVSLLLLSSVAKPALGRVWVVHQVATPPPAAAEPSASRSTDRTPAGREAARTLARLRRAPRGPGRRRDGSSACSGSNSLLLGLPARGKWLPGPRRDPGEGRVPHESGRRTQLRPEAPGSWSVATPGWRTRPRGERPSGRG